MNEGERFTCEVGRWKAPEILSGEEEKETNASCAFTLGMVAHTMILQQKPFPNDSHEVAMEKIQKEGRPFIIELEKQNCPLLDLMIDSWYQSPTERIELERMMHWVEEIVVEDEEEEEEMTITISTGVDWGEDEGEGEGEGEGEEEEASDSLPF
jgi:hypothetical protein